MKNTSKKKKKEILLKTSPFKRISAVIPFHDFVHGVKVRASFVAQASLAADAVWQNCHLSAAVSPPSCVSKSSAGSFLNCLCLWLLHSTSRS